MLNLFKKKQGQRVIFKITGMHCVSCGMNIDGELEETPGVYTAQTSFAKSLTTVTFDPAKISLEQIKQVIGSLNYTATEIS